MVNYSAALDATFGALADPTRRAILERLAEGDAPVTALAEPFRMSLPGISKHLRVLERAGLLTREREGRVRRCCLVTDPMRDAARWIARYRRHWETQFDALARYLDATGPKEDQAWRPPHKPRQPRSGSPAHSRRRGSGSSAPGRTRKR
ncbi:MAG TPA: metalloregulator ArsR/SmtB family transcription factor [Methylomirabilota bacterium]|nr:metalloregulator ArsR/SmtB family transcription factor [Methylomirabilota bacterium]